MVFKVSQLVKLAYLTSTSFKVNPLTDKTVISVILDRHKSSSVCKIGLMEHTIKQHKQEYNLNLY
jgi:hypothetical protein